MQDLALFPLQLVVYPGESLNLHIFEPRYRELIRDAEENGITFGVPTVIDGKLRPIATEVSLTEVAERYPSGESDVRTRGHRIFQIQKFSHQAPGKSYPGGRVRFLDGKDKEDPELNAEIIALTQDIYQRLSIAKEIPSLADGFRTYDIAHYVGLSLEQEYELLTLTEALPRQEYLLEHLKQVQPRVDDPLGIRERARLNGHFKNLTPPNF